MLQLGRTPRSITIPIPPQGGAASLFIGSGASALEIVVLDGSGSKGPIGAAIVRSAWKSRHGGRAAPVLLVVLQGDKATICGPAGDEPPTYENLDRGQVERICREALEQPDRHAALRYLKDALGAAESKLPGIRNEGLLAQHELEEGARRLDSWNDASKKGKAVVQQHGESLLRGLGFAIDRVDQVTSLLRAGANGRKTAVAVLLRPEESPDLGLDRFGGLSPASYALAVADRENIPNVIVSQGRKLRLYPTAVGVGVGRRGRTETFVEVHTGLLRDSDAAYLWLLFSAEALLEGGSFARLLAESKRFAGNLAERLRDRVYGIVVPALAQGLATAQKLKNPSPEALADTYSMAMTVLFRLLFIAYAEDKDLLPYAHNALYRDRSLKKKAQELADLVRGNITFEDTNNLWRECDALFEAVDIGNRAWGVPAYDGGLFARDAALSPIGAKLASIELTDRVFGPALTALLCIETTDGSGLGPVDFRSLGVREFGTIYEGLLESELSLAEEDLAVDEKGFYRPARARDDVATAKGRVYLHNRSGARKSSGSYFTKSFAVEHLLDQALEPALQDHLGRLEKLDDDEAASQLFDFRVADIAMGSGHFLVAAVDRIERAFTGYLAKRALPGVRAELARLRQAANDALGGLQDQVEIEDTQLLRRLIARRCIYGVDLNPVAVDLARVSIWIHTFVPGLPLSLLDRNLVVGNSLVGIGTVDEIVEYARGGDLPLFTLDAQSLVGEAVAPLKRLARLADASPTELKQARAEMANAKKAAEPAEALFDIVTACRIRTEPLSINLDQWDRVKSTLPNSKARAEARKKLGSLCPFHFPVAFPEVFLRERSGFDVILGNPPWEKARVEEHEFWARHMPGIRGLDKARRDGTLEKLRRERRDLVVQCEIEKAQSEVIRDAVRHFPGMNTGHPDLFRAFLWRFLSLIVSEGGWTAVVLPGDTFKIAGAEELRLALAKRAALARIQLLTNKSYWIFDDVDARKLIAFVMSRSSQRGAVEFQIPKEFHDMKTWEQADHSQAAKMSIETAKSYSTSLVAPTLPKVESWALVTTMMRMPRLEKHPFFRVRRVYADFETSKHDRAYWHDERKPGDWPVYGGEAFEHWIPDSGNYYAFTDAKVIIDAAHNKWRRAPKGSPLSEIPAEFKSMANNHPTRRPRIAFRDVTNRTNTRTLVAALIPPDVVTVQTAPWVLWVDPSRPESQEACLLGFMCSLVVDWWARRFVEGHFDQEAFNCLRVPQLDIGSVAYKRIAMTAGRLAAVDDRFAPWAKKVGVDCGPLSASDKDDKIHELDAVVAHLYGLSERQLVHIFETFHEGWDYESRLRATLKHFVAWRSKSS